MAEIIIAVLLSLLLGPGVGQLYNREYKKGAIFIATSMVVLMAALYWFGKAVMPYIPTDIAALDTVALAEIKKNAIDNVIKAQGATFYTYQAILAGLWIYSAIDAYFGAVRRNKAKAEASQGTN